MSDIEELWRAHSGEVRSFLRNRCADRDLVEDLTNETFLHASKATCAGSDIHVGWLITVARRRLVDQWRTAARNDVLIQAVTSERSRTTSCELASFVAAFEYDHVRDALEQLPATQRMALILRYCHGCSVSEVATELTVTYSAAESLLSRGRQNLRRTLDSQQLVSANA